MRPHSKRPDMFFFLVVLLLLVGPMSAQRASQGQYTRSLWKVQDGLPESTVQALVEMPDGFLWVGTTGGLTRFDGSHFNPYPAKLPAAPAVNSIFCLAAGRDGSLWVGTEGGGLLHLEKNASKTFTAADGLTDGFIRSILIDHLGTAWVGTDNGLFEVSGDAVKRIEIAGDPGSQAVHGLMEDREGRIWVGGPRLLTVGKTQSGGTRTQDYPLPGRYSSNRVKTILQSADGVVWVGTVSGLMRLVHGSFERVPQIANTVRVLKQTSDGTVWIGTIGGGLWTCRDGVYRHVKELLPSNTVLAILEDTDHQLWLGLQDGLLRLSRTPVRVLPLPGGTDADFETISGDGAGRGWAVGSQVYRIVNGEAHAYRFPRLPGIKVRNVFRDREGDLWVGTDGSGAYRMRGAGITHYSATRELTNNFIRGFLETRRGEFWIATDEGVNRMTRQGVRKLGMAEGLAYSSTRSLLEDASGGIWIGTEQGLSHWADDRFLHDAATDALQHEKVWSILEDTRGLLWFGTRDHGIFLYDGRLVRHLTTADGLLSNSIYQILEDPGRRLWLSGPGSISSLQEDQFQRFFKGQDQQLSVSTYAMPYGAEGAQMYGGREPAGYVDPDGGVWFPSSKGAIHVLLTSQFVSAPPRLVMEKVTLDGTELPPGDVIHVKPQMTRLEFHFAPLSLRSQVGIRYRYKLENFDTTWLMSNTDLTASYTNLPAGHYRFVVEAFNAANPADLSVLQLPVEKTPYVWQTWWFLGVLATALSFLAWAMYKSRMHQVKLRFKAVLDERGRLAREMHDTVIQGCTSISALLEAVASMQQGENRPQDQLLNHARAQVRTTINEARETVWNLRHEDEPAVDLVASLEAIAHQASKDAGLCVTCRVDGDPIQVAGPVTRELLMVTREAVYNAVRHGLPNTVTISATFEPARLLLRIADDGVGFTVREPLPDGHYGITGMRERLKQIGGSFAIVSHPGAGTEILLAADRLLLNPVLPHGTRSTSIFHRAG